VTSMSALLYEAAAILLTRIRSESALRSWGLKLLKRAGFKRAVVGPRAKTCRHLACDVAGRDCFRSNDRHRVMPISLPSRGSRDALIHFRFASGRRMRSNYVPASLRGSCKTFPLFPSGRKVLRESPRFLAGAWASVILNFGLRLLYDRASYIGRPIRANAHHAAATVDRLREP
jgi:hypothetical protein